MQRHNGGFSLLSGLFFVLVLSLGMAIGWWLRDSQSDHRGERVTVGPAETVTASTVSVKQLFDSGAYEEIVNQAELPTIVSLVASERSTGAVDLAALYLSAFGENFTLLVSGIGVLIELEDYAVAIDWLKRADLAAVEPYQQARVVRLLEETVDAYATQLMAANRVESVVSLYRDITFTMPELPAYFLRLGTLQVQAGDYDAALTPLSHIQNHAGYEGKQARELIAQIEKNDVHGEALWEELPLSRHGNQFVVEARLDGTHPVSLLIDTGAAMTVVSESVIAGIGYNLNALPVERFTTANGVVEAPVLTLQELSLGDNVVNVLTIGALALDMPNDIHGLLGMNFLRHFDFRIDQSRGVLQLTKRHR